MSNRWNPQASIPGSLKRGNFWNGREDSSVENGPAQLIKLANNQVVDNRFSIDVEKAREHEESTNNSIDTERISVTDGQGLSANGDLPVRTLTRDISLKLNGSKRAFNVGKLWKSESGSSKRKESQDSNVPIYYKPPSTSSKGSQYGIKRFLPPNFDTIDEKHKQNTVPLIKWSPQVTMDQIASSAYDGKREDDYVADIEDDVNPKGMWVNPVVKEALSRQVNKGAEVKRLIWSLFNLAATKLVVAIASYILTLYELRRLPFQSSNAYYPPIRSEAVELGNINFYTVLILKLFYGYLVLRALSAIYRLSKGQDQCLNLPLNAKQRALIGLRAAPISTANETDDPEDSTQLVMEARRFQTRSKGSAYELPKYSKSNIYSTRTVKNSTMPAPESQSLYPVRTSSDLDYDTRPKKALNHASLNSSGRSFSEEINPKLASQFQERFDIDFDVSDTEDDFSTRNIAQSAITTGQRDKTAFSRRYGI